MIRTIVVLFAVVGAAIPNPVLVTHMSEVGFDSAGRPWVEFNVQPQRYGSSVRDVLLVTGSSVCTLDFDLDPGQFVVLDSEVVAQGELAHGTFRLNPLADSLMLRSDFGVAESVRYPVFPTGLGSAPAPPPGGSVACYNLGAVDACNWYVDSTPTRGALNDDYSSIGGRVDMDSTLTLDFVWVWASGWYGTMSTGLRDTVGEYVLRGLGVGAYRVTMAAYVRELGYIEVTYPESVRVGYSQAIGGINFRIPSSAVAEQQQPQAPVTPQATLVRGSLLLPGTGASRAMPAALVDPFGRKVLVLHRGQNDVTRLSPGIYFVLEEPQASSHKPQAVRKVVVQR